MTKLYVLKRDGTEILRGFIGDGQAITFKDDYPSAGSHTYTVEVGEHPQTGSGAAVTGYVGDRAIKIGIFKK